MFKAFVLHCVVLISTLIGLMAGITALVDKGLHKTDHPLFREWNDIATGKLNADIVINGSSRARSHISPGILDSTLNLESYNLGLDGHQFDAEDMRYKFYRKHNTRPRLIVQTLDLLTLTRTTTPFQRMQFAPYLQDTIIANGTKKISAFKDIHYMLPFTKYSFENTYVSLGLGEWLSPTHHTQVAYKGYRPHSENKTGDFDRLKEKYLTGLSIENHPETVAAFHRFLADAKKDSVTVVLVYTPEYHGVRAYINNREDLMRLYQDIAAQHGVTFLDYSEHDISKDKRNFYDATHLHRKGAEQFTRILAEDLAPVLRGSSAQSHREHH